MDQAVFHLINERWTHPVLDLFMAVISNIDIWKPFLVLLAIGFLIWGGFRGRAFLICLLICLLIAENVTGLLKVISNFGGTNAANRAEYMTGAAYLQTGEFDKAIKHLKEFDANGAYQTDIKRDIMLGHAYAEQKKSDDALSYYKKAASVNEKDEAFTADALITAAGYAASLGKKQEAIDLYEKARDNYPAYPAVQSGEVDKYLASLGVVANN